MAHKRMFSRDITTSDAFRDMSPSAQALYFHFGMEADDDGFIGNVKGLMKSLSASDDDLLLLFNKRFLIPFPTGIVVVKHWKMNNFIRKDRYVETRYIEEKKMLRLKKNGSYTDDLSIGQPLVDRWSTQNRREEKRIVIAEAKENTNAEAREKVRKHLKSKGILY